MQKIINKQAEELLSELTESMVHYNDTKDVNKLIQSLDKIN